MTSLAYAALWVFVFSVPWERMIVLPGISIVSRVTGTLALGLALLAVVTSGRVRRLQGFHVAGLLFVILVFASLFALRIREIPEKCFTYLQLLLMVWMIWELAPSKQRLVGLLTAYVLGAYITASDTIMLYRTSAGEVIRFAAGGADPNDNAMVLALGVPIAWYLGTTYRRPLLRWVCRAYLPVAIMGIGLTGSRGGMLAGIVALLIVPLTITKLSPARLATAIVILGISGAAAVAYVPDKLVQRFASTGAEVQDLRLGGRFTLWRAGVQAFAEKPVLGYGTGAFRKAVTPQLGVNTQVAHNSFLSVLVEQGIVGFLLYSAMFIAVFLAVMGLPTLERRFALVLLATLGIAMLPLTWEHRKAGWFVLAALTGLSHAGLSHAQGSVNRGAVRKGQARRAGPRERPPVGGRPFDPLASPGRNATP
jgi:O-antigen ligase